MVDSHDIETLLALAKEYLREHNDPEVQVLVDRVEYVVNHEDRTGTYDHG